MSETENFKTNLEDGNKPKKFDFVQRVGDGNLSSNSDWDNQIFI